MATSSSGGNRILIVDDCTLYREGLAAHLAADGADVRVAWDLQSLRAEIECHQPEVILLNIGTRDSAGLLRLSSGVAGARVVAVGVSEDDEPEIVTCAEAGVAGYHLRSESLEELVTLIQRVRNGESACSPRVGAILLRRLSEVASWQQRPAQDSVLTAREEEILQLLEMGMSNREIASLLCIAVHTVKNHVHSILSKLGVRSRAEAVARMRAIDQSPTSRPRTTTAPTLSNPASPSTRNGAA